MHQQISDFGQALIFIIGGILLPVGGIITARFIRPNRPNEEKNNIYECGEETQGPSWSNFNMRFYLIALVFILFEVEIAFLFPWATVFGNKELITNTDGLWGWFTIFEAIVFILILAVGLVYVWAKGFLDWDRPEIKDSKVNFSVPKSLYDNINKKYSSEK